MKQNKNNRGMALLLTLIVITILIAGSLEFNRRIRASVESAAATRDRMTLTNMAFSGIHIAMAILVADKKKDPKSGLDSIQEEWADPEIITEVLDEVPFPEGKISLVISDELSRVQVNALVEYPKGKEFNTSQRIMWDRFSRFVISQNDAFREIEATEIVNSLKDWLDFGDDDAITGLNGAESDYYQDLDPPYACGNGPLNHIGELALVKGFTRELLDGIDDLPGITEFLTVYGMEEIQGKDFTFPGKININTASLPVLMAVMPSENPEYAQAIFDYRQEKEGDSYVHDLSSLNWYKRVPDIPDGFQIDPNLIRISSDFFRIEITAELNGSQLTESVVVRRVRNTKNGKWECRILGRQNG